LIRKSTSLRRWLQLRRREKAATVTVACLVPIVSTGLWLLGFQRTLRWLERTAGGDEIEPRGSQDAIREWANAMARLRHRAPWTGRCLARSLALRWILRRQGIQASLSIGVRIVDGQLAAHAWVMADGRVLADSATVGEQFSGTFRSAAGSLSFSDQASGRD